MPQIIFKMVLFGLRISMPHFAIAILNTGAQALSHQPGRNSRPQAQSFVPITFVWQIGVQYFCHHCTTRRYALSYLSFSWFYRQNSAKHRRSAPRTGSVAPALGVARPGHRCALQVQKQLYQQLLNGLWVAFLLIIASLLRARLYRGYSLMCLASLKAGFAFRKECHTFDEMSI